MILKYLVSFKPKLTDLELWMSGGNASFNTSADFDFIVAAAGSCS